MRKWLGVFLLFLLLGAVLAMPSCGGGGAKPPRFSPPAPEPGTGGDSLGDNTSEGTDLQEDQPSEGSGAPEPPPVDTDLEAYVFISLDYDFSNVTYPIDPEKMFADFSAEPTVKALQEIGFELVDAPGGIFLAVTYTGLFKLAPGWTLEQAMLELPQLFPDISAVEPAAGSGVGDQWNEDLLMHKGLGIVFHHDVYSVYTSRYDDPEYALEVEVAFRSDPDVIKLQEMGYELVDVWAPEYAGTFLAPIPDLPLEESIMELNRLAEELKAQFPRILDIGPHGVVELFAVKGPSASSSDSDARGGAPH